MGSSLKSAHFLIESRIADAARGDADACYDLGMVYSSGAAGIGIDLVEAHKWFNIAAIKGSSRAAELRSELSATMSKTDIARALREAREWMTMH